VSLQEITGMEGEVVTMQEIFKFERHGLGEDGAVIGELLPTGIRPSFTEQLRIAGVELPAELFERRR
jgi:pilus assembly protein CpaF